MYFFVFNNGNLLILYKDIFIEFFLFVILSGISCFFLLLVVVYVDLLLILIIFILSGLEYGFGFEVFSFLMLNI